MKLATKALSSWLRAKDRSEALLSDRGASTLEYALLIILLIGVVIAAVQIFGPGLSSLFTTANSKASAASTL